MYSIEMQQLLAETRIIILSVSKTDIATAVVSFDCERETGSRECLSCSYLHKRIRIDFKAK